LPLHAAPEAYRQVVAQIKHDPLSLGALVTTHKMDLYAAAQDLFDELDPYARITRELSCISKTAGRLVGHAKDPVSVGLSMHAVLGSQYFGRTGGHVLLLGAGGAATATVLHLLRQPAGDRPTRLVVVDRAQQRLDHLQAMVAQLDAPIALDYVCNDDARGNDELMARLPPGSLVINATGMGKDSPGSPITDDGVFPQHGVAWEFNYRGALDFLHQARRQAAARNLHVADGWVYFLHGWSQVIAQVLQIELTPELFMQLDAAASS
jgi:shikimate dehydrogenase